MNEKPVTIKDIASDLGVSLSTVHKAIYNKKGIGEETRQRILQYIDEQDFRINRVASSLKRRVIRLAYLGVEPLSRNFFYSQITAGILQVYEAYRSFNVELQCFTSPDEVESQTELLEKLYQEQLEDLDGIILVCSHEFALNPIIRKFKEAGVYIVTLCSDARNSGRDCFVGIDGAMIGAVAEELAVGFGIPKNSQALVIGGSQNFSNHRLARTTFIRKLTDERPDVDVIEMFQPANVPSMEEKIVKYLKAFKEIGAIYCITARSTYDMCRAVKSLGLSGKIKTIGTDVFTELRPYFLDRTLTATVFQNPYLQAECAFTALYNLITKEKPVEEYQYQKSGIVIRSNMEYFMK